MLADIRRELPRHLLGRVASNARRDLAFDELHVTPCRVPKCAGVVIGPAGEVKAIRGDPIPLFAGHLACFAANAQS
jgi:hypothetical protein